LREAFQAIRRPMKLHNVIVAGSFVGMRSPHRVGAGDHDGQQIEAVVRCGRHLRSVETRVSGIGAD